MNTRSQVTNLLIAVGLFSLLVASGGCLRTKAVEKRLQDEDPSVRLKAIHDAGEIKSRRAVPYLVDRLTDSEQEIRMFAILALEKITGTRNGYEYYAPPAEREEAVQRWREWLKKRNLQVNRKAGSPGTKE